MRRHGNPTFLTEESRDAWGWRWFDALLQDVRFAVRIIRREAIVTTVAVLTLGIGIGANTLVFSLLEAVALRPLPYPETNRLFMLWTVEAESRRPMNSSYPAFRDWQEQSRTFLAMAAFHGGSFNLTGAGQPEAVDALYVTEDLLKVLGIQPIFGRTFLRGDNEHVALLSHALWTSRFGKDLGILGNTIQLDRHSYTVIGILPDGFHFPPRRLAGEPYVFVPMIPSLDRGSMYLQIIGRLRPGVTEQQARAEMDAIAVRLEKAYPAKLTGLGITVDSLRAHVVREVRPITLVLLGAVGFVLLIACANVANLLLSQGASRQREIAIRVAIGATRSRVIRLLLTESLLLASVGCTLGVVLAYWGLPVLAKLLPERTALFMRVHDTGLQLNPTVLGFTVVVSLIAGILFGTLPALKSSRPAHAAGRYVAHCRMRGALVALEISLSFVLLAGAGLMINSVLRVLKVDVGFRTDHLLIMSASLPEEKYPDPERGTAFFRQILPRLQAVPGVLSDGCIDNLPLSGEYSTNSFEIEGGAQTRGQAIFHAVSTGYFHTMEIPLMNGREFSDSDSEKSPLVALVNRNMAARYWPNKNPIGKAIIVPRAILQRTPKGTHLTFAKQRVEIIGIVGDVHQIARDADLRPELFLPYAQRPSRNMTFVMRTAGDPELMIPAVQREIWRVDPDQPVTDISSMDKLLSADIAQRRFVLVTIGMFALIAILLAAVGIFGVVSYSVRQRAQEIAIRMALGAQGRNVVRMLLGQAAVWLLVGIAAGTAGAVTLTRLLESYLYGVRPLDPASFIAAAFALIAVALAAHAGPARRATQIDPIVALRCE